MTIRAQIESVFDRVRPWLNADGCQIELLDLADRKASVWVSGKCAGCPSSHLTLHVGVETALREEVPDCEPHVLATESSHAAQRRFEPTIGISRSRHDRSASAPVVVGESERMREVFDFVNVIADSESSVLVTGESGTGKELIAHLIHHASPRRHRPFVAVSCAILSESLIESELFGHERGAFTNAFKERPGRFELAEGGTLFLDDIDDVPLSMQVKLLRVLQSRTVERVGGSRAIPVDVRVLIGSKRDLRKLVDAGSFREDLFYRLNVIPIQLPPLRERTEDIPLLTEYFFKRYFQLRGAEPKPLSFAMQDAFMRYPWPGNVRELENACERIAQTCMCDCVVAGCVPAGILFHKPAPMPALAGPWPVSANEIPAPDLAADRRSLDERVQAFETRVISGALHAAGGNKSKAAMLLNVKRSTLGDRIKKLGLGELENADSS